MALRLSLPKAAPTLDPKLEIQPVFVEEWIEHLPYADPPALMRAVYKNLRALNQNPIRPAQRFDLLELHLKPYTFLAGSPSAPSASRTFAAMEKTLAEVDATRRIAQQMALGYKQVLAGLLRAEGEKKLLRGKRRLASSAARSVQMLTHTLFHAYWEYLNPPTYVWSELNQLYRFAKRREFDQRAVEPERADLFEHTNLDLLFKTAWLITLVDPHHIRFGNVWRLGQAVIKHAHHINIKPFAKVDAPAGVFLLDLSGSNKPVPVSELEGLTPSHRWRLFDTRGFIQSFWNDHRQTARAGDALLGADAKMLVETIGDPPKRVDRRQSGQGSTRLLSGLATVHHFLSNAGANTPSESSSHAVEITDNAWLDGHGYRYEVWTLTDSSRRGVGLLRDQRPSQSFEVGELIAIRDDQDDAWHVGAVRWMQLALGESYRLGIEILGTGRPVTFNSAVTQKVGQRGIATRAGEQHGIFITSTDKALDGLLALPPGSASEKSELDVEIDGRGVRLRIEERVETLTSADLMAARRES